MSKIFSFTFFLFFTFIAAQRKWNLKIYNETVNREFLIFADNAEPMPMSVQFDFTLQNLSSTLSNHENVVVPAHSTRVLLGKLTPIKKEQASSFSYMTTYNFGDVTLEAEESDYVYDLPFETGKTYRIYQGYHGKYTHRNENSLDFSLKTGDKIFAARAGVVIEAEDSNSKGCNSAACASFNNRILVLHDDGTVADYSHLKYKGAAVAHGESVAKGQFLGFSGNTGYSSGPHLHFAVFINRMDGKRDFLRTLFRTGEGKAEYLQEGKFYTKPKDN